MIEKNGVARFQDYIREFPEDTVLRMPKAIIECYKEIPCNPCETSCPFKAITVGENINARPLIDFDRCTGCGVCASKCPGLAISIRQFEGEYAKITVPFEFLPRPLKGDKVNVVNREGILVDSGEVLKVLDGAAQNKTALITLKINRKHMHDAAAIEVTL